jgi:hypothetical protein
MLKSHEVWLAGNGPGPWPCAFCGQPVARLSGFRFGEKRAQSWHGIVHHHDENHGNNDPGNLRIGHNGCHVSYHGKKANWPRKQAADWIRQRIMAGELGPLLPTYAELGAQIGVNPRAVYWAVRILKDEGVIVTRPGRGVFVA